MRYKIVSIRHSGKIGTRGFERVDGRYPDRVGRIVDFNIDSVDVGKPLILEYLDFGNQLNVHLLIDTDIYDGYEVHVNDGMVTVVFHEIKNEAPVLKDYGHEKFVKSCE